METTEIIKKTIRWGCLKAHRAQKIQHQQGVTKHPPSNPTRPGKPTKNYGNSPFLMGTSTISMTIFNSYVKLPEGILGDQITTSDQEINKISTNPGMLGCQLKKRFVKRVQCELNCVFNKCNEVGITLT